MTRVEKEMYRLLEGSQDRVTLAALADFYVLAHNTSHRIYSKIDWERLDAAIKSARGQAGLDHVRRAAVRQQ